MIVVISICNLAYIACIILVVILLYELRKYLIVNRHLDIINATKARQRRLEESRERVFGSEKHIDTVPPSRPRELPRRRGRKSRYKDDLPPFPPPPPPARQRRRRRMPPPPEDMYYDDEEILY